MLTLHMRVLQPEVTRFLVAEATSTYDAINQGRLAPNKPAVLSEAIGQRTFPPDLAELTLLSHGRTDGARVKTGQQVPEQVRAHVHTKVAMPGPFPIPMLAFWAHFHPKVVSPGPFPIPR